MLSATKADVLTPANAVTTLGLLLTAAGSIRLDTPAGFWLVTVGKLMDVIDGQVARRTHTSNFGALYDITADKFTMLIIVIAAFYYRLVPLPFLIFILFYHGLVAAMASDAILHKLDADPSRLGKYTMALHICAILLFIFANVMHTAHHAVYLLAVVVAALGVATGIVCLIRYIRDYIRRVYKPYHK